jgi:hypothetical protein
MAKGQLSSEAKVICCACLLFISACFLPCIDRGPWTPSSDPPAFDFTAGWHFGLEILLLGWGGENNGVPWSANVFFALGLWCLWARLPRTASALGIVATGLGLTTWSLNWFARESDYHVMIGYYFWQGSLLVLAAGGLWASQREGQEPQVQKPDLRIV